MKTIRALQNKSVDIKLLPIAKNKKHIIQVWFSSPAIAKLAQERVRNVGIKGIGTGIIDTTLIISIPVKERDTANALYEMISASAGVKA